VYITYFNIHISYFHITYYAYNSLIVYQPRYHQSHALYVNNTILNIAWAWLSGLSDFTLFNYEYISLLEYYLNDIHLDIISKFVSFLLKWQHYKWVFSPHKVLYRQYTPS